MTVAEVLVAVSPPCGHRTPSYGFSDEKRLDRLLPRSVSCSSTRKMPTPAEPVYQPVPRAVARMREPTTARERSRELRQIGGASLGLVTNRLSGDVKAPYGVTSRA
jgi:hypothetical protein